MGNDHERFRYKELSLSYKSYGEGSRLILAFHGFGRIPEDFEVFLPLLQPDQRLISISLFQHGDSVFPEDRIPSKPLDKREFADLIAAFLQTLGLPPGEPFDLLGYSLGGKVCLALCEVVPERIRQVILLAPDGLKINRIYQFSSHTSLGRAIYRYVLHHPKPLFRLADVLLKIGVINHKVHRFVHFHMDSFEKRKQVYEAWLIYRRFDPSKSALKACFSKGQPDIRLFFGKYDSIIRPEIGKRFVKGWGEDRLHILEIGHLMLVERTVDHIRENNLWF